jgi:hypothetical protein
MFVTTLTSKRRSDCYLITSAASGYVWSDYQSWLSSLIGGEGLNVHEVPRM